MVKNTVKVAVIGFGYWGPNMVRNFNAQADAEVIYVADFRKERLDLVNKMYPSIQTTQSPNEAICSTEIDAVVIATPVFTHFELALKALNEGKHVLLEKPMVSTAKEATILINLAEQKGLTIMVDHTFLYTGAVQAIKRLVDTGMIGQLQYIDSTRINLGLFQSDVNVLWDLAPHDISILNYLTDEKPYSVQATGVSHTNNGIENIAYLTMNYESNMIAHFNCSWTSPVKIRKFLIGGDRKMIVFDDTEPTEKIRIYDTSYHYTEKRSDEDKRKVLVDYRVGDIQIPKVPMKEALAGVAADFIAAILHNTRPISDYISGINVIKVLEASQISIKNGGKEVKVDYL
ncbi:Gfo/Idh/MocA family protein [Aureispira anguillae]|uniref:Gfo/Idh/MocA family oxidoreductase n=1 Tax=Aureispira anguillae TaxID=2864201 RepID=A0A915YHQ2_9BACT|nr:Gfo/Idh/MocA family oxidoreductase [Aureispira anguillae]BDS13400.1 Gfo/Idh/MocA family oxidoreductase [Aureispira anguillae]